MRDHAVNGPVVARRLRVHQRDHLAGRGGAARQRRHAGEHRHPGRRPDQAAPRNPGTVTRLPASCSSLLFIAAPWLVRRA